MHTAVLSDERGSLRGRAIPDSSASKLRSEVTRHGRADGAESEESGLHIVRGEEGGRSRGGRVSQSALAS